MAASLNAYLPATPGSVDLGDASSMSVVAFALTVSAAPALLQDRELLYFDEFSFGASKHFSDRAVEITSTVGRSLGFVASVVPDGGVRGIPPPGAPPTRFRTEDRAGILPASIHVSAVADGPGGGVIVALVPGAQGIAAIPVQSRFFSASLRTRVLDRLVLPGPSTVPLTARMAVEVTTSAPLNPPLRGRARTTSQPKAGWCSSSVVRMWLW